MNESFSSLWQLYQTVPRVVRKKAFLKVFARVSDDLECDRQMMRCHMLFTQEFTGMHFIYQISSHVTTKAQ